MTQYTEVTQKCYSVTLDPSTQEHYIETSVIAAGELPITMIFVFTIGAVDRPTSDIFSRVANPQDLQNLKVNRDQAIAIDGTEYLASYLELKYTDINVAVQAKAMLRTRINELINGWLIYRDKFIIDSDSNILFPSSDPEVEKTLIKAYSDAKIARTAAEINVGEKDDAVDTAKTDVTISQETHVIYKTFLDYHVSLQTQIDQYNSLIAVAGTPALKYWTNTLNVTLTGEKSLLTGQELSSRQTIAAKQKAVETAVQEKAQADQELAAAQAAENAALAAVLAVLPTFDPASV